MISEVDYKIWRRWLYGILVLGVVLVVQLPIVARSQPQPYPGIVLPGFRETSDGSVLKREHTEARIVFSDGTSQVVDLPKLMNGVRQSAIEPLIDHLVTTRSRPSPEVTKWLRDQVGAISPSHSAVSISFCLNKISMDVDLATIIGTQCDVRRAYELE